MRTLPQTLLALCLAAPLAAAPPPQPDLSKVEIQVSPLAGSVQLLQGAGGNIVALSGADGVLLVDTEFAPLAERIHAALRGAGATQPVRFVIDTHYHYDHTDGNAAFARDGATLIAQANLRTRLASGGTAGNGGSISIDFAPAEAAALPGLTYEDEITLYLDQESVRVHHYPNAHTDGDSVVFFTGAHVVHMGDIFVRYGFPFIDVKSGGSVRGMIAACEDVLRTVPADSHIVPGHGAVAAVADLREYTKMLTDTSARVSAALAAGKSLEQMKQEKLLAPWSERYSPAKGFISTDAFLESLYSSLAVPAVRHGPPKRPQ